LVALRGCLLQVSTSFELIYLVPEKVKAKRLGCLFPAAMSGTNLFFVMVNRFWCIWMRALVFEVSALRIGPGFLCWVV